MTKIKIISLISFSFLLLMVAMPAGAEFRIISCTDCNLTDFQNTIVNVSKIILGLSGSLALLMFVYGGFTWLISSGNKEMVSKGKNIIVAAVIGLFIVFIAFTAVEFMIRSLTTTGDTTLFGGQTGEQKWNEPPK